MMYWERPQLLYAFQIKSIRGYDRYLWYAPYMSRSITIYKIYMYIKSFSSYCTYLNNFSYWFWIVTKLWSNEVSLLIVHRRSSSFWENDPPKITTMHAIFLRAQSLSNVCYQNISYCTTSKWKETNQLLFTFPPFPHPGVFHLRFHDRYRGTVLPLNFPSRESFWRCIVAARRPLDR